MRPASSKPVVVLAGLGNKIVRASYQVHRASSVAAGSKVVAAGGIVGAAAVAFEVGDLDAAKGAAGIVP